MPPNNLVHVVACT
ncbi:hypothetical protein F383_37555 [Gossypium arboreum]|uniref:Uncharacterized protein n=1 Tax=Gossypium arboreum TaxID=29729 RepID=A0A0B0MHG0_GOSAR|nr:hypothetical protein F383_37555 [Gossypium arboreum]